MNKVTIHALSIAAMLLAGSDTLQAAAIGVTNFTEIENAIVAEAPPSNVLFPIVSGDLTITHQPGMVGGSFGTIPNLDLDNPNTGGGYLSTSNSGLPTTSVTLNFSMPLAAFGVTFMHLQTIPAPAILTAFDGPNGTGSLLGTIQSTGFLGGDMYPDFVAIWSDSINIRSAMLTSTASDHLFGVDAYGYSLTPVPEPSSFFLLLAGVAAVLGSSRKRIGLPFLKQA